MHILKQENNINVTRFLGCCLAEGKNEILIRVSSHSGAGTLVDWGWTPPNSVSAQGCLTELCNESPGTCGAALFPLLHCSLWWCLVTLSPGGGLCDAGAAPSGSGLPAWGPEGMTLPPAATKAAGLLPGCTGLWCPQMALIQWRSSPNVFLLFNCISLSLGHRIILWVTVTWPILRITFPKPMLLVFE